MQAASSADRTQQLAPSIDLSVAQRLFMIGLAYLPMFHLLFVAAGCFLVSRNYGAGWGVSYMVAVLYLVPPLAVRMARPRRLESNAQYRVGTHEFFVWWYTAQWQVLFNRIPQLEELLRLVPGMYSAWLRLWGARIGPLVYWSPGTIVFDRPFLNVGARTVIGAHTTMCPHFLHRTACGNTELVLASIEIGADAMIGGAVLLPAGVTVDDCEQTPGGRPVAPFSRFEQGKWLRTKRFQKEIANGK